MDGRAKQMLESTVEQIANPENALEAGVKFGLLHNSVTVMRDSDPGSQMMANAFMSGLMTAGAQVTDAGHTSVPVAHQAFSNILVFIGNPDHDGNACGISAYNPDGTPFTSEQMYEILKNRNPTIPDYKSVGQITRNTDADNVYISKMKESGFHSQGYIILDCGCGTTSGCATRLLTEIGADVVSFNTHDCNGKPPRSPSLAKTNLLNISNFVNASIGSIGIAFNSDGTRLALLDESGQYVPGDRLLALLLMYMEPKIAVVPFDSPFAVEDAFSHPLGLRANTEPAEERRLIRAKNDIQDIIGEMKKNGAEFGALNDGTFIFAKNGYCPDAIAAAMVISELAGIRSVRNVLENIPVYSSRTIRINFDGNIKLFGSKLEKRLENYDIQEVCTSNDEWKMILKKGTYIIRQSDLNPQKLLVFAESSDSVYLITMLEQAKDIIDFCI